MCVWHKNFKHEHGRQYHDSKNCNEMAALQGNLNFLTWQYMNEIMAKQLLLVLILYIIFHNNGNAIFN